MPALTDRNTQTGLIVVTLTGPDGKIKARQTVHNLITDAGDLYGVTRLAAGVLPAATADATKVTGMKLGSGTTAAAKSGAGAALVTYITGTNLQFDAGFPSTQNLGAGLGYTVTYQCTYLPGVGTAASITEIVLVNDAGTNATSTAANTTTRSVFTAMAKAAGDTLTFTWTQKQLGV